MLIYLDTSQIYFLTNCYQNEKGAWELFIKQWHERNAVLCLSLGHLHEIAQLDDKRTREKRYQILKEFNTLYFTPFGGGSIIQFEAINEILEHLPKDNKIRKKNIKRNIWNRVFSDYLRNYVEKNLDLLLKLRIIYRGASDIEKIFEPAKRILKKYYQGNFKSLVASKDDLDEAKRFFDTLKPETSTAGKSDVFFEKMYATVKETGSLSGALIKLLKLEGLPEIEKRRTIDGSALSEFYQLAREAVPSIAKISGISQGLVGECIGKIDLGGCPGFSLQMALKRAFCSSGKKIVPSDWLDADHVVYAPYVDIFYADKRTYDFLHRETRNRLFPLKETFTSNIRRIVPLNRLIQDISI